MTTTVEYVNRYRFARGRKRKKGKKRNKNRMKCNMLMDFIFMCRLSPFRFTHTHMPRIQHPASIPGKCHRCRYNIVFLVLTYGIPMLIMLVCYTLMGKELWGSKSIGEHTQRQTESVKSKKKVSKILLIPDRECGAVHMIVSPCVRTAYALYACVAKNRTNRKKRTAKTNSKRNRNRIIMELSNGMDV